MKSVVYGLEEMFLMANSICKEQSVDVIFEPVVFEDTKQLPQTFVVILLPPSLQRNDYVNLKTELIDWLRTQHSIA